MATGAECCSAGGVVMTTLPRLGPRRANRAPMREMSRTATALARCSSATVSSPSVPAVSDGFEGRCHQLQEHLGRRTIRGQGGLEHAPGAGFVAGQQPGLELGFGGRGPGGRVAGVAGYGRLQLGQVVGVDLPGTAHAGGRELAGADIAVDGHVVHAQLVRRLLQRQWSFSASRSFRLRPPVSGSLISQLNWSRQSNLKMSSRGCQELRPPHATI